MTRRIILHQTFLSPENHRNLKPYNLKTYNQAIRKKCHFVLSTRNGDCFK